MTTAGDVLDAPRARDMSAGAERPWFLFSPSIDIGVFLGSGILSLVALLVGHALGLLDRDPPEWTWIAAVLLVDVAHVYATVFRVYTDPHELARAPVRYTLVPLAGLAVGVGLYAACGAQGFWRVLAYLAVFHFVRQQYGWTALYRARLGEHDPWDRRLDAAAIYVATLYPLLYWHAHLPRRFWWFIDGDFVALPTVAGPLLIVGGAAFWIILAAYAGRAAWRWQRGVPNPGKDVVVATTAICWYVGIVALDSDYAFTVTNVLIHGIPYLALVYAYGCDRAAQPVRPWLYDVFRQGPAAFLAVLWGAAFIEELVWDRAVWHSRPELFGAPWEVSESALVLIVPLLALPQLVHYLLDGFVWRQRSGPFMRRLVHGDESEGGTALYS